MKVTKKFSCDLIISDNLRLSTRYCKLNNKNCFQNAGKTSLSELVISKSVADQDIN